MWHFSTLNKKLGYSDGRIIRVGETLKVSVKPVVCFAGLHASERIMDALRYAPGPYVWFVELGGEIIHGEGRHFDKSAATERRAIWGYDATEVLRAFSRKVALDAVDKCWNEKTLGEFPKVARKWLVTGDETLRVAAYSAAYSADLMAGSAAVSAAQSAAQSAATAAYSAEHSVASAASAANLAAHSAAVSAKSAAESAAANSAAYSAELRAARDEQNKLLEEMVLSNRP